MTGLTAKNPLKRVRTSTILQSVLTDLALLALEFIPGRITAKPNASSEHFTQQLNTQKRWVKHCFEMMALAGFLDGESLSFIDCQPRY
jgi:hypothetical protein